MTFNFRRNLTDQCYVVVGIPVKIHPLSRLGSAYNVGMADLNNYSKP